LGDFFGFGDWDGFAEVGGARDGEKLVPGGWMIAAMLLDGPALGDGSPEFAAGPVVLLTVTAGAPGPPPALASRVCSGLEPRNAIIAMMTAAAAATEAAATIAAPGSPRPRRPSLIGRGKPFGPNDPASFST
jgi:hypothetical protein